MLLTSNYRIPQSRAEAKKRGCMYYMEKKLCANGHTPKRYTSSGKCIICIKENKNKRKYKEDLCRNIKKRIENLTEKSDFEESW